MEYFRAMQPDSDDRPLVGRSGRTLGVRVPQDIGPDQAAMVHPAQGGMSVAPETLWNVPNHRRPRGLGSGSTGPLGDRIYAIDTRAIQERGLAARPDPAAPNRHAFVEPSKSMSLDRYERALVSTRPSWQHAWPR